MTSSRQSQRCCQCRCPAACTPSMWHESTGFARVSIAHREKASECWGFRLRFVGIKPASYVIDSAFKIDNYTGYFVYLKLGALAGKCFLERVCLRRHLLAAYDDCGFRSKGEGEGEIGRRRREEEERIHLSINGRCHATTGCFECTLMQWSPPPSHREVRGREYCTNV